MLALIASASDQDVGEGEGDHDGEAEGATVLGLIKSEPEASLWWVAVLAQRDLGVLGAQHP